MTDKKELPNKIVIHKENAKARIKEAINSKIQSDKDS